MPDLLNTALVLPKLDTWLADAGSLRNQFRSAQPFPLLVIDGFLDPGAADALVGEFPDVAAMPKSKDYVFGDKRELSSIELAGPACAAYYNAVTSNEFCAFLSALAETQLFIDPRFHGGGFHQGADGSFLDMHVDFNIHPLNPAWLRTINVLLYLNKDWDPAWGGQLLTSSSAGGITRSIEPDFNRCVIMLTDDHTFHGYRKTSLPPGVTRRSIAAYAYQPLTDRSVRARTTRWAPEKAGAAKRLLARYYDPLVKVKTWIFGSGTAHNR